MAIVRWLESSNLSLSAIATNSNQRGTAVGPRGSIGFASAFLHAQSFLVVGLEWCHKSDWKRLMDIQENWEKALSQTQIIHARVRQLQTFDDTMVPYILLSESLINAGDTVVRKGDVTVTKPSIILPPHIPQFDGFKFDEETAFTQDMILNFLMVRGVSMPSMKYRNETYTVDVFEGALDRAVAQFKDDLQKREDVHTGLIVCPDDCWHFSLLLYIGTQVTRNAQADIRNLLERYRKES